MLMVWGCEVIMPAGTILQAAHYEEAARACS